MASCGLRAGRAGPVQAGMAGNQQRQPRQRERQDNQEEEVDAVGEQQADLATGHHPDLLLHGEPNGRRRGFSHRWRGRQAPRPARCADRRSPARRPATSRWCPSRTRSARVARRRPAVPAGVSSSTWSHMFRCVSEVCDVSATTTTQPRSAWRRSTAITWCSCAASSPALGSSTTSSVGLVISSIAIDAHRRSSGASLPIRVRAVRRQLELVENLVHHAVAVLGRGVRRQPQFGGVSQRSFDGEARVRAVVARTRSRCVRASTRARRARRGSSTVTGRRSSSLCAGEQAEQRGVARRRRPDDRGQCARTRRERHAR